MASVDRNTRSAQAGRIATRPAYRGPRASYPAAPAPAADLYLPVPPRPGRSVWPILLIAATLAIMLATLGIGIGAAWWAQSDLILPGVDVMGIDIGGRDRASATTDLQSAWASQRIILEAGDETWAVTGPELGLILAERATLDRAYAAGRSLDSIEAILRDGAALSVEPVWTFDPVAAENTLRAIAAEIRREPVNAGVAIRGGRVEATPAEKGRALDAAATLAALRQNPGRVLTDGRLALVVVPVEPAVIDTAAVAEAANRLLATTVTVHIFDPVLNEQLTQAIPPETWSAWLSLEVVDAAAGQFSWQLDAEGLEAYLAQPAADLGPGRYLKPDEAAPAVLAAIENGSGQATVRAYHHPRPHVVQSGETLSSIGIAYGIPYPWIQAANPDLGEGLFAGQTITIPSPDELLPVPVVPNKRIVVSISQQRTWVYENGALKWDWPASTGIDSSPTAPGIFQIQSHELEAYASIWDLYMPYFMGVYRPVPSSDFMNGFHGFPTRDGRTLLWTGDLGHKVTYGCILLSSDNEAALYEWAEEGVVVEIQP
jgi:lipoprotein-anchoring transpeptidase ErfK/SrfK